MGRHTKLALLIAPFLMLGGYIASDYWVEHQAGQTRIFTLQNKDGCDVHNKKCILSAGEFEINVYNENGHTWVNATYALDSAVLFLVDDDGQATAYPLGMSDNPFYWHSETPLGEYIQNPGEDYKLRLIAAIKGGRYIGEFYTQTN